MSKETFSKYLLCIVEGEEDIQYHHPHHPLLLGEHHSSFTKGNMRKILNLSWVLGKEMPYNSAKWEMPQPESIYLLL